MLLFVIKLFQTLTLIHDNKTRRNAPQFTANLHYIRLFAETVFYVCVYLAFMIQKWQDEECRLITVFVPNCKTQPFLK